MALLEQGFYSSEGVAGRLFHGSDDIADIEYSRRARILPFFGKQSQYASFRIGFHGGSRDSVFDQIGPIAR
jgi:hypothetical protein